MFLKILIFIYIDQDPLILMASVESKSGNESKPKRTLNPIIKAMNDYRNNVIGEHIGSKAPKRTAPIFKITLSEARTKMGLDESSKNTIEVVDKASELFSANPDKYVKMASENVDTESVSAPKTKKTTKEKKTKEAATTKEASPAKGKKSKAKETKKESTESPAKEKKKVFQASKKTKAVVESESESESDSDDDSFSN